jgi:hypothetical protein
MGFARDQLVSLELLHGKLCDPGVYGPRSKMQPADNLAC